MHRIVLSLAACAGLVLGYGDQAQAKSKDIVLGFAVALTGWMNAYDGNSDENGEVMDRSDQRQGWACSDAS